MIAVMKCEVDRGMGVGVIYDLQPFSYSRQRWSTGTVGKLSFSSTETEAYRESSIEEHDPDE